MIRIITVYQSLNPGSYLQSTALFNTIQEKYSDVAFYNTHSRSAFLSGIKLSIKLFLKRKFSLAIKQMKMAFEYKKGMDRFAQSSKYSEEDIAVLGSDEIWNVSRKDVSKYPIFWGVGLRQERCIAYAPSINSATVNDLKRYPFVSESLERINKISVRDKYSKREIEKLTKREVQLVCDPVMLLPVSQYRKHYKNNHGGEKYILIYGPKRHFDQNSVESIIQYAKTNGFKLYSYYFYHDWVEEVIYGDPYCFLELIDNAGIVFTSTFHGTVFSIMYNKCFLVFGENKKVQELLELFDLQSRVCMESDLESTLTKIIDYGVINSRLSELSSKSKEYLYTALEEIHYSN